MLPENTGVLWRDVQPQDDIAGGVSRVVPIIRCVDGLWIIFNPADDTQVGLYGDTSGCTNFTCTHSICMQINRMIANNEIPADKIAKLTKYGFIKEGKISLSPRYNYFRSGTVPGVGNYLYKPWDAARHFGMVPDALCPFPARQQQPPFTPAQYATVVVTPQIEEAARVFSEIFDIVYETINSDENSIREHLKEAPIAVITGVCPNWDSGLVIPACGKDNGHAMCRNGYTEEAKLIFDSYNPNQKKLAPNYPIRFAIKGVVTLKENVWKHTFNKDILFGEKNDEVKNLQIALKINGVFPAAQAETGYYGPTTQAAVKAFQKKYQVAPQSELDMVNGKRVGIKTRNKLNSLFA